MNFIILLLIVAGFSLLSFFVYKLAKEISSFESSIKLIHTRIDKIFTIDAPEPNEAIKTNTNEIDLSTTDMQVPKDVKLDIEGGDSNTPPGFEEKK